MARKTTISIITIVMAFALLTGCGNSGNNVTTQVTTQGTAQTQQTTTAATTVSENKYGDTGGLKLPLVDKPTTITAVCDTTYPNINDLWLYDELEKRTGIRLELTIIPQQQLQERTNIMLSAGTMTDIAFIQAEQYNVLGTQGVIVALNKYADIMPNFKRLFFEENPWVMKSYTAEDGNLYYYPYTNSARTVNHGYLYRKDIFDKHGIKAWTNTEEFYQALKKLKELYPDSYPFSLKTQQDTFMLLGHGWGISTIDWKSEYPMYYEETDKTWKFGPAQQKYKDMLDFLQKLYKEELMDPEFLTNTPDLWTAKMTTGKSMVTWDWIGRMSMWKNQVKEKMPEFDMRYGVPVGPEGKVMWLNDIPAGGRCIMNNKRKEAAMKLLDYMSSPSGMELMTMGQEGVTYNVDSAGKISYVGFDKDAVVGTEDLEEKYGLFPLHVYPAIDRRSVYFTFTPQEQEAQDLIKNNNLVEDHDPILKFTTAEAEQIVELKVGLERAAQEFASKFVVDSSMGSADWDKFLNNLKSMKVEELEKIYNQAQERYNQTK